MDDAISNHPLDRIPPRALKSKKRSIWRVNDRYYPEGPEVGDERTIRAVGEEDLSDIGAVMASLKETVLDDMHVRPPL